MHLALCESCQIQDRRKWAYDELWRHPCLCKQIEKFENLCEASAIPSEGWIYPVGLPFSNPCKFSVSVRMCVYVCTRVCFLSF